MKRFELCGLGEDWIWEAETEEEATLMYIKDVCNAKTVEAYEEYMNSIDQDPTIDWKEVK